MGKNLEKLAGNNGAVGAVMGGCMGVLGTIIYAGVASMVSDAPTQETAMYGSLFVDAMKTFLDVAVYSVPISAVGGFALTKISDWRFKKKMDDHM